MERTIKNNHCKKILAFILMLSVLLSIFPLPGHKAYAAQQNSYHDPAEHWMSAVNRTNELDANAVVTQETFTCYNCGKATQFTVWRTPEYTRSGSSNLSHNVKYSDGIHTVVAPTLSVKAPVVLEAAVPVESVVNAAPAASAAGSVKATRHVAGSPATCTSPQTCIVCGVVLAEATGHRYWQETTQPTCTTMGYTTYNCINCNMSYKSDYVDALNHDYKEDVVYPTCTEAGYTTFTCKRCGDSYIGNYREATGHKWDKGVTVVGSTCNGAGMTEYRCLDCNESRLETQDPAGHTPGREADCVSPQLCTVCGAVLANAKGHSFEEKIVASTCTEIGYTEAACKDCGLSYKTEYTNALCHKYNKEVTSPTCLEQGYIIYTCANCGDSYVSDYTKATGHNWNGGTLVVNATCGGEGMFEYRCANCEAVRLENEGAIGHTPGKEADCLNPQVCTDCGAVLKQATGHNMQANVIPATCLEMGYYLDGRASALWGIHTHVPTADERVYPKGTGYITDLGMKGPIESVLGVEVWQSVEGFLGGLPGRYKQPDGPCKMQGAIFTLDSGTGLCTAVE